MTDVELYKTLSEIKNDIDPDDTEKHEALRSVLSDIKDRLCTISVGDEVLRVNTNELQVVTYVQGADSILCLKSNGDTMSYFYDRNDLIKGNIVKTGKNYPQIEEVLRGLSRRCNGD